MTREKTEKQVSHCYSTWGQTYYDEYLGKDAAYPPVHQDLIKEVLKRSGAKTLLDAGCGPASLIRDFQDLRLDRYGFDLTPEMIAEAKRVLGEQGVPPEHLWVGSVTSREAFTSPGGKSLFDAAICIGVLPHIPEEAEAAVLANLHEAVRPDGLVIIQGRNQLFSLFTLNRYSFEFMANTLVEKDRLVAAGEKKQADVGGALEKMKNFFAMDLPPIRQGKAGEPGYDEVLSRSHNPLVLAKKFAAAGFQEIETLFYHFHCLPPMLESRFPEFFKEESIRREQPDDWRGYFMASAFLLVGKRA